MIANIFVFIMGSIVGSFLNVCIHRLPKGESIITPASHCPTCKAPIRWHDNIPILSYLMLKGKCRACGAKIPFRYLLVEVIAASLSLSLFIAFGFTAKFYAYSVLVSALIVSTFVDFEVQEIPDEVTLLGFIMGIGLGLAYPSIFGRASVLRGLLDSLAGALTGGATIYLMGFLGEIVFKKEAMGGGDVKLLAMIGAFLGWRLTLFVFFLAPVFGSAVGIILKIREGRQTIPYGPYLSLGAIVAVFWGERILRLLFYGL